MDKIPMAALGISILALVMAGDPHVATEVYPYNDTSEAAAGDIGVTSFLGPEDFIEKPMECDWNDVQRANVELRLSDGRVLCMKKEMDLDKPGGRALVPFKSEKLGRDTGADWDWVACENVEQVWTRPDVGVPAFIVPEYAQCWYTEQRENVIDLFKIYGFNIALVNAEERDFTGNAGGCVDD